MVCGRWVEKRRRNKRLFDVEEELFGIWPFFLPVLAKFCFMILEMEITVLLPCSCVWSNVKSHKVVVNLYALIASTKRGIRTLYLQFLKNYRQTPCFGSFQSTAVWNNEHHKATFIVVLLRDTIFNCRCLAWSEERVFECSANQTNVCNN